MGKVFAAVDVGSYEIGMKIFEISDRNGLKEIDYVRRRIELGTDTYHTGKISYERMDELCAILKDFTRVMETYQAKEYRAYGTSAIRETENTQIVLDQIRLRTGLKVEVLSNSEQRFLNYKSVALRGDKFNKLIEDGTAFLDIGGGSIQVSLFEKSSLVTTQNIRLGILRIREELVNLQAKTMHYESLIEELIDNDMHIFRKLYLNDMHISNLIIVDDYISYIMKKVGGGMNVDMITGEQYLEFVERLKVKAPELVAKDLGIPAENSSLLLPSAVLIKHFVESTGAKFIWMPGVSLSDGIAYDYAEKQKLIKSSHDFEADIISSARSISKRYRGSSSREETLAQVALSVFDSMKKLHGLGKRERLLLQIASRLQDCGKYISITQVAECSFHIIMSTEIIGLSHMEREIVAYSVKSSYLGYLDYDELMAESEINADAYLVVAKLTAILRAAAGLVGNRKKAYRKVKSVIKDRELVITVDTDMDLTLEKGFFPSKTDLFEEVFGIRPVVKKLKK